MIDENKIYYPTVDELELGLDSVSLVNEPAIELNFLMFNKQEPMKFTLSADDKMIVTGPALVPDKKIYRHDEEMGDYWIVFTADTIKQIVLKYFKENQVNNINNEHTPQMIEGTMIESWFSKQDGELGYDVPEGTWFVSYQIEDPAYWNESIKSGKVKGFSIEGMFKLLKKKVQQSAVNPDEVLFNKVKEMVLELDEQLILDYFKRDDVGVKSTDLDLSAVQYEDIAEDEFTRLTLDTPDVYYYYDKKADAVFEGGGKLTDDKTRSFCKEIVSQAKYFSAQEIVSLSSQLGYSVFSYAGGNHCRHRWTKATNFKFLPRK
jgi:hypothetical protein